MFEFHWAVFLEVKNEDKARLVLKRIENAFGQTLNLYSLEKYWKIEGQWKARFMLEINAKDCANAVFEGLQICASLSGNLNVSPPQIYGDGGFEFAGYMTENFSVVEVKLADFLIKSKVV